MRQYKTGCLQPHVRKMSPDVSLWRRAVRACRPMLSCMDPREGSGGTATAGAETQDQTGHALRDLAAGYPEFRLYRAPMCSSRGQRWVAERVRGLDPGLH